MSQTQQSPGPLSPTTGEPVAVVARRNRVGIWLCIVSDAGGTLALLISYSYLWSLNVNNAWAPPNNAFADPLPFWLITLGAIIGALLLWWGVSGLAKGKKGQAVGAAALSVLVYLVSFIGQIVQLSTFPFDISDGSYASATFWLCIASALHLFLMVTLALGVLGRTRAGLISHANPWHARLVAMYGTWVAIAIFLGALFATTMTTSPNTGSPPMGDFQQPSPAASASAGAAGGSSSSTSPAASPSAG